MTITIAPAQNILSDWRRIYWGEAFSLSDDAAAGIVSGAELVDAIVLAGVPVYGINTGFGKLASVRIENTDLATLQRNLILSHSVGVGELLSPQVVRLIAALKVASLSQGASGIRLETVANIMRVVSLGSDPCRTGAGISWGLRRFWHLLLISFRR